MSSGDSAVGLNNGHDSGDSAATANSSNGYGNDSKLLMIAAAAGSGGSSDSSSSLVLSFGGPREMAFRRKLRDWDELFLQRKEETEVDESSECSSGRDDGVNSSLVRCSLAEVDEIYILMNDMSIGAVKQ